MHRALLSAVLSLSVLLSTLVAAQNASYTFTPIDVPGFRWTVVVGLNGVGDIDLLPARAVVDLDTLFTPPFSVR
jgi:hypothetical protein